MECTLVHDVVGRARIRLDEPAVFNGMAGRFEAYLAARPGIRAVRLSPAARSVVVTYDPAVESAEALLAMLRATTAERLPATDADASTSDDSALGPLALSTAALFVGDALLANALLLAAAMPIFTRALDSLRRKRKLNVDVLDASATAVLVVQRQTVTAAAMVWLISLGDFIRDLTVQRSRAAIEDLFDGKQRRVGVIRDGRKRRCAVEEIRTGDVIAVYSGDLIPVDGTVIDGRALVDQKLLTGESMPVEKTEGERVYAGTAVSDGRLYCRAAEVGRDTVAGRIVQFVRDVPVRETRTQNYAEQFADRLVPWSFAGAAAAAVVTRDTAMAASLLIIDYGTGIRVSAPTTVLASIAHAARRGILFKGGRALEELAGVDTVVLDKTGTLTSGVPEIVEVLATNGASPDELLALAAGAEQRLNHPVAKSIVRAARARALDVPEREASRFDIGLGVQARIAGATIRVGSARFMESAGIAADGARDRAGSPVFVSRDHELVGVLFYADPVRPESAAVVAALRERGVRDVVMVTGDDARTAAAVAGPLGIEHWVAGALPAEKVDLVRTLQREGRRVAVVGDGINDSPALSQADVGIAVCGGTDLARTAAHVVLLEGNLWNLVRAVDVSRRAIALVEQNWQIIASLNTAAIGLSVLGITGPVGATIVSNGSAILASLNALRPLAGS